MPPLSLSRPKVLQRCQSSAWFVISRLNSTTPQLIVQPKTGLIDEQVNILGKGFPPETLVELRADLRRPEDKIHFSSTNRFLTSQDGTIDTSRQEPVSGSYVGIHSAGPLWSMTAEPGCVNRLWPSDTKKPLEYTFSICNDTSSRKETLASTSITRSYLTEGVKRIEVREGGLVGTLFIPNKTPAPAIITIFGGVNRGAVPEDRAALLASKGFVTFALAFFGVDQLPKMYSDLDIEYFESALDWVLARNEVCGENGVGLSGISQGGNIALAMAQFLGPKVGAVCVQGATYCGLCPGVMKYKDQVIQSAVWLLDEVTEETPVETEIPIRLDGVEELERHPERQIFFEKGTAPVLGLVGEEDEDAKAFARFSIQRAAQNGKKDCQLVEFEKTGHLIDLPYSPVCTSARHPYLPPHLRCWYGGQMQPHALAQFDAWERTLAFFSEKLAKK